MEQQQGLLVSSCWPCWLAALPKAGLLLLHGAHVRFSKSQLQPEVEGALQQVPVSVLLCLMLETHYLQEKAGISPYRLSAHNIHKYTPAA